jgi:hypothetical protein
LDITARQNADTCAVGHAISVKQVCATVRLCGADSVPLSQCADSVAAVG